MAQTIQYVTCFYFVNLVRPRDSKVNLLIFKKLQKLLEVLVIVASPTFRILLIIITLHKAIPRGKPLKESGDIYLKDVLAIKLLSVDVEMASTTLKILLQLRRNLNSRKLIDPFIILPEVEWLARPIIHHQAHMNEQIKTHWN